MSYVLICGGRHFTNQSYFNFIVNPIISSINSPIIINGGCVGADELATNYAKEFNIPYKIFPANWSKYGKAAGPIRNKQMIDFIKNDPDAVVIGFCSNNSVGTRNTLSLAKKYNIKTYVYSYKIINEEIQLYEGVNFDGKNLIYNQKQDSH